MHFRSIAIAAAAVACAAPAARGAGAPVSFYVAPGGLTAHGTSSVTAGVAWPPFWQNGAWTAHAEGFASAWRAPQAAGRENFWQLGLLPVVRYRFGAAAARVFVEAGLGLTLMDRVYTSRHTAFSTRLQFQDMLGVGMSLGSHGQHEVGVRFSHFSNGGIKRPNPGENFVQLRYGRDF